MISPEKLLQHAATFHQAGRYAEAEELYLAILQAEPKHPDANHNLGLMAMQQGLTERALPFLQAAWEADPSIGHYWQTLAECLLALGKFEDALNLVKEAIKRGMKTPQIQQLRLLAKRGQDRTSPPSAVSDEVLKLFRAGRHAELERRVKPLLEQYPGWVWGWSALGAALQLQDKDAEHILRHAALLAPHDAVVQNNLGAFLSKRGRLDEAVDCLQAAIRLRPKFAEAHFNLGAALLHLQRLDESLENLQRAVQLRPTYVEAYLNMGAALNMSKRSEESVACYRRALEIMPDYAEAHSNLGNALKNLGRLDEAEASYRRALEIDPDYADAYSNLLFALNFQSDVRSDEILALCREYNERFCLPHRAEWQGYANSRDAHRRLRIGYVSPDFRRHAVAYFAEPILANHDKTQVEIFCYAEVMREDEYTGRFRQFADHWHSTVGMSDGAVAQMIRDHRIDILVDLAGHTAGNRLLVFARKPAPIQVTYLGYPGTTGLSAMDYRITDHYADPDGVADARYTERLLRLPDSLCCYRPSADMPEVSPLPALERGYLTFGSFNNFNKIDLPTFALWAELLHALPTSRLMMLTVPEGETRLHLEQNFARLGIDRQRLEFYGKLTPAEFHRKFQEVDITLDPVSVSGGTTTCESLWMGVPVMASVGGRFITRVSYSFLSTAGLADFAAFSPVDYIRLATHLADNLPLLAEIRAGLRAHVAASPLIDEVGFTRNLESLYREAWRKWCGVN